MGWSARSTTARTRALLQLDPATAVRFGGTVDVLGKKQQVSIISEMQLAGGRAQITPRDIRLGDADADPLPAAVQRTLSRAFTLTLDPGALPLQVTPTTSARHQRRTGDQRAHRAPRARPGRPDELTRRLTDRQTPARGSPAGRSTRLPSGPCSGR